jgi:ribosomal protein L29
LVAAKTFLDEKFQKNAQQLPNIFWMENARKRLATTKHSQDPKC